MKTNILNSLALLALCTAGLQAQTTLDVEASKTLAKIQPTMYGVFFEDINFAADGGLYAEMIKNRSFEFKDPLMGWTQPKSDRHNFNTESGIAITIKDNSRKTNPNYLHATIKTEGGYELRNEGFRGMGIVKDARYNLSVSIANPNGIKKITFQFVDKAGKVLGETSVSPAGKDWKNYTALLTATATEAKASLRVTFTGTGTVDMDMVSLFPQDTWKGRKNGMRKDLVQLLFDLQPGFLRFPGGCIVEGRTLAERYQWKKTVGPVDQRETLINRWNEEFAHKPTPDYFQTFGLGFYEYFQLSEDLGAEPLPILSCGMACQFNTGELVPMDELDPYVQDALDLIEFANGGAHTAWGKVRADMGHAAPFNLKMIGVGNEQWGPDYIERYKVFEKAIKAKYPKMIIVSGSGPFPEGDYFEYGHQELKKLNAEIVDEHYYKSPQWFRENATRYDQYDRKGPKIFAGEYAAQSVAIASPDNKNNWECAFSEAAFMTGLERNAEVVHLTSYAPLMAHEEGWQWTPDMIWFNNLQAYGSANYQVQRLFSNNKGTDLVSIKRNGKDVTGQDNLFASAVKDAQKKTLIVKLVNTSASAQAVKLNLKGVKVADNASLTVLSSTGLTDENTFANPTKISPTTKEISWKGGRNEVALPAYSLTVFEVKLK